MTESISLPVDAPSFAGTYLVLGATTATTRKRQLLVDYLSTADPASAAWAVHLLSGNRFKRLIAPTKLRSWAAAEAGLSDWLWEESYQHVGDQAETVALLVHDPQASADALPPLGELVERHLLPLASLDEAEQRQRVVAWWRRLGRDDCLVFGKLLGGAFRAGVAKGIVMQAVAQLAALPKTSVQLRLAGEWVPSAHAWQALIAAEDRADNIDPARPYPFFLASPLEEDTPIAERLGDARDWLAEWKWDGMRGQLVKRGQTIALWSRGEELVTDRYPEIQAAATHLPDGVYDGEIIAWRTEASQPLPFADLQTRMQRKRIGPKLLRDVPVTFCAYDCLERNGEDIRDHQLTRRREWLERIFPTHGLRISPTVPFADWVELAELRAGSRERGVEGLMLKQRASPYRQGRVRGDWWKWKVDPLTIDCVLLYAQPGHGRRSGLCTDYTLGCWSDEGLVPVAKAYSGLTDDELQRMDRWIRRHTVERFGPVRSVVPEQVFEIRCDSVQPSPRRKSGVSLRFPRIGRWRTDKPAAEADTLAFVQSLAQLG